MWSTVEHWGAAKAASHALAQHQLASHANGGPAKVPLQQADALGSGSSCHQGLWGLSHVCVMLRHYALVSTLWTLGAALNSIVNLALQVPAMMPSHVGLSAQPRRQTPTLPTWSAAAASSWRQSAMLSRA
eukprot:CAMPEP_0172722788 /NCGR_PEP_ID=MMETSP1074-20121228/82304_1 /TAXON_ID=2916 /ORGANISM="Ceratium fusus, Strain PA161109" /LENGTH=129 /DNA_ID=CAMNT_0013548867 /DNA_START=51 /DNA_END=437 /DNA_ORIENTATION=+